MNQNRILIIDDEPQYFDTFCDRYKDTYSITLEDNDARGIPKVARGNWDAVVVDLDMGKGYEDGLSRYLPIINRKASNRFPVLVHSSDNNPHTSVIAKEIGATGFLNKRESNPAILHEKIEELIHDFDPGKKENLVNNNFIARSKKMLDIQKRLRTMVNYPDFSILILGETGVGKEVAAKYLHHAKGDDKLPFESINLSAFSKNLLRSEIFGHVKGAFTGANTHKKGLFALAKKGTLLLDEIGELDEATQIQLLRVLQERTYKEVGGLKELALDTQLIFATNKNLDEAVKEGSFRADFYERISSLEITIPPLRERKEDIIPLIDHFLAKASHKNHPLYQHNAENAFTEAALKKMHDYFWPHNIRQLANTIQKLIFEVDVRGRDIIDIDLLPMNIIKRTSITTKTTQSASVKGQSAPVEPIPTHEWPMAKQLAYEELNRINTALIQEGGRKEDAAKSLGLKNDQTLRYRIKKKYFEKYPDLFENFPTICKIYKLKI